MVAVAERPLGSQEQKARIAGEGGFKGFPYTLSVKLLEVLDKRLP